MKTTMPDPAPRTVSSWSTSALATLLVAAAAFLPEMAAADGQPPKTTETDQSLLVCTAVLEPFVIADSERKLSGFYIDLWEDIAFRLGKRYRYQLLSGPDKVLPALAAGKADVGFIGVPLSTKVDKGVRRTYAVFHDGLQILARKRRDYDVDLIIYSLWEVFNSKFVISLFLMMGFLILFAAHLVWHMERGRGTDFPKQYGPGIMEGIWWTIETITTVGFGKKNIQNPAARIFGVMFMLLGPVILGMTISVFTSKLTINHQLPPPIHGPADLRGKTAAVVENAFFYEDIEDLGMKKIRAYPSVAEGAKALRRGEVDCVIASSYTLKYFMEQEDHPDFRIVGTLFAMRGFSFGLPADSHLVQHVDRVLFRVYTDGTYEALYQKWFGFHRDRHYPTP